MKVINDHADKTGKKVMYAFNISGEIDEMLQRYEYIVKSGGTCAMVSINSVGMGGVKKICDQRQLAIHAHRNGWGMLTRHPLLGIDFRAYQKLWRVAGVESDDSVVASIKACLQPFYDHQPLLPVVSSGQWGGQAPETYRRTNTVDLLYMAGGGIMAHPMGAAAGVVALQQAWKAAVDGLSVEQAASQYKEFAESVKQFGK
jgi:ribulose-bisphosphate carboxylase large chain